MFYRILAFLLLPVYVYCQNTIGLPEVINYYKKNYNAGLQNWDIKQDKNGIIYSANNEGLLSFDGKYWKLHSLPNKTILRSIEIGNDGKIFAGGQDEIGYFSPTSNGQLEFTSLLNLIPEKDRSFGDIWDIVIHENCIFFRTNTKIFKIQGNAKASVYNAASEWYFLGTVNGKLFAQDNRNGLFYFEKDKWKSASNFNSLPINDPVTAILPLKNDSLWITTLKHGILLLFNNIISKPNLPTITQISTNRIYAATSINSETFALATNNGGVFIIDKKGLLVQHFSRKEGLQNNNILSIMVDRNSNIWLGLDNGIDLVEYNSSIKHIAPIDQEGSGYTAMIFNNNLYTGTSSGLYSAPIQNIKDLSFSKGTFSLVSNTIGQNWKLAIANNKLLLAHHEGCFVVNSNNANQIPSGDFGFWNFIPLSNNSLNTKFVGGNYKGIALMDLKDNSFIIDNNIPNFNESSRFIAVDNSQNIWVSHPYHGVYKLTKNETGEYKTQLFAVNSGLPSSLNNHIFKIKNQILAATENGIYTYNEQKNLFEPSEQFKKILGQQSVRYLQEDADGNIWFFHEKNLGVIDYSNNKTSLIYFPELNNKLLSGFEFVYPFNSNNIFIGGENGFYHINYENYRKNAPKVDIQIRNVRIIGSYDSLLFGGYYKNINDIPIQSKSNIPSITSKWNTIQFEYSASIFGLQSNIEYKYRLKGIYNEWSEWSGKTEKEFNNLPAGKYSFEVVARNNLGIESSPVIYSFEILPPWYRSAIMLLFYFILFCFLIFYLYRYQSIKFKEQEQKHDEEQKKMQYYYQLEIDKAENELIALKNEKLLSDINFKNAELATSAMHLVQKGELLTKIKADLNSIMKGTDNPKTAAELKKMIKILSDDDRIDKDWEQFSQHFDNVHSDFSVALKEKHPNISPSELKLSAYLRMNLSTKEIAQLLNISVRGVEVSRYRLRKKLEIPTEVTFYDYLIKIEK